MFGSMCREPPGPVLHLLGIHLICAGGVGDVMVIDVVNDRKIGLARQSDMHLIHIKLRGGSDGRLRDGVRQVRIAIVLRSTACPPATESANARPPSGSGRESSNRARRSPAAPIPVGPAASTGKCHRARMPRIARSNR